MITSCFVNINKQMNVSNFALLKDNTMPFSIFFCGERRDCFFMDLFLEAKMEPTSYVSSSSLGKCYFYFVLLGMFRHTWWSNSQQWKLIGSLKVKDLEHTATGTQKYHNKPRFFLSSCTIILIMWNFQSSYLIPHISRMAAAAPAIKSILRK